MLRVEAIHSGGQTGADQGGLAAALTLELRTGGWMPKGFRTDTGPLRVAQELGMKEHHSTGYPPRTRLNVQETDGTLLFGYLYSPGTALTRRLCVELGKPFFEIHWRSGQSVPDSSAFLTWLNANDIVVLNVAGNRESKMPGVARAVHDFIVTALS